MLPQAGYKYRNVEEGANTFWQFKADVSRRAHHWASRSELILESVAVKSGRLDQGRCSHIIDLQIVLVNEVGEGISVDIRFSVEMDRRRIHSSHLSLCRFQFCLPGLVRRE